MYKILGFRWLLECFCPAPTFVMADSDDARNPQHFIHVTVSGKWVRTDNPLRLENHLHKLD